MVTISHLVKKFAGEMPFLHECMCRGIINYASAAELLRPAIERELGKRAKPSAIAMAMRRYAEESARKYASMDAVKILKRAEISMRSGVCDISVVKSSGLFSKLKSVYSLLNYEKGDVLNIVHGNFTVTIVANEFHRKRILEILEGEKVMHAECGLAQISLKFPKEYIHAPGVVHQITRQLSWNNINIIEIVSSLTELGILVSGKDAVRAYSALEELIARDPERK